MFEELRPDEIGRIGRMFTIVELEPGERHGDADASARMVVVVRGDVAVDVVEDHGTLHARMSAGDSIGTYALVTGYAKPLAIAALRRRATIASIDRAGFEQVLAQFPAVALPLARELASELGVRDDFVRQLLELHAAKLPAAELGVAIAERRAA